MKSTEKERLIKSDIQSIESRVRHVFNQGYDLGYKDGLQKNKLAQSTKAIPLDKIKKFKKEVENKYDDFSCDERDEGKNEMINEVLEMLDKLTENVE